MRRPIGIAPLSVGFAVLSIDMEQDARCDYPSCAHTDTPRFAQCYGWLHCNPEDLSKRMPRGIRPRGVHVDRKTDRYCQEDRTDFTAIVHECTRSGDNDSQGESESKGGSETMPQTNSTAADTISTNQRRTRQQQGPKKRRRKTKKLGRPRKPNGLKTTQTG